MNHTWYLAGALSLPLLLISNVNATPLNVSIIPWIQGDAEAPHIAVRGEPTALQAIAEGGECDGRYEYRWDWNGDGDFADVNEWFFDANSADYGGYFAPLPLDVTLPNTPGDHLFYPKVEVRCGAEVARAVMPVISFSEELCSGYRDGARSPDCQTGARLRFTRNIYTARAIDRALWYLFLQMEHQTGDGQGHADAHLCRLDASKTMYALGHALTAFLRRGHGHGEGRDADPYYRHATECGLNSLLTTMSLGPVQFDDVDDRGFIGEGLSFSAANGLSSQYWSSYESTAWAEPIALFGAADYVVTVGGPGTFGRQLSEVAQDLTDGLIDCMGADSAWPYLCAQGQGTTVDASSNGWAPEALRLLNRAYGVETYSAAQDGQRSWVNLNCPGGVCPYQGGGTKLAGNALVSYGWTEAELFDPNSESGAAWSALGQWYDSGSLWGLYYVYAAAKGLRSFTPELTELPNGVHFTESLVDFFVTGEDATHIDASARQLEDGSWTWRGDWVWGDQVSEPEVTAIVTQMLQSWLEVSPVARAFPREVGPGESVTFDHSLTHRLSHSVSVDRYRWDVGSYIFPAEPFCDQGVSGCQDLNGDGDCGDAIERCNEDRNGDGLVTADEVAWELDTADPDEQLTHTYLEELDWGESTTHTALLEVTDSNGRVSTDDVSVEVSVSLANHPPIPVPHPAGRDVSYVAHPGAPLTLDGRASYDPDALRDPYPGDNNRAPGVRDSITSIAFDLNFDGDYDDEGEDALDAPVQYLLPEDVELGDRLTVSMRVCDDGQWSDQCLDGVDQADCSRCAYGSAVIEVVPNLNPPVIDTCPQGQDCEDGYTAVVDGPIVGTVQLDLSESYDPDGDLGLSYTYEVIEGTGELLEAGDFPGDMGARPLYRPIGEGVRVDRILATVTDSTGLTDSAVIEIALPNVTPSVAWGDFDIQYNPPLIIRAEGRNEWSGRFRVVVDARVIHGAGVSAQPDTYDAGDSYTVFFDYDDDGVADQVISSEELFAGAPPYSVDDGYTSDVTVWCEDDDGAESNRAKALLTVASKSEDLIFRFDVGADGIWEEDGTLDNYHEFFENDPTLESIPIEIEVIDDLGATARTLVEVSLLNRPPEFILTQATPEDYTVTFVTSALDPDLDPLSYTFTPGDGGAQQVNSSGVFAYNYPEAQASYSAEVVVSDGRGGEDRHTFEVSFLPPVDLPPVIDLLSATAGPGGDAEAIVEAHDPENQQITVTLDWGDGETPSRVVGGRATRTLAYRPEPYQLTALVTDPSGQTDSETLALQLVDQPTVISAAQQSLLSTGERMFTVIARDLDSPQLEYFWDYDGDGVWEEEATAPNVATYLYPDREGHSARVGVRDPWSGVMTEVTIEVPATLPLPPEITNLTLRQGPAGHLDVVVEARDPDSERLTYEVTWGDTAGERLTVAPLGLAEHSYAYRSEPYVFTARVTDPDGLYVEEERLVQLEDLPTLINASGVWLEGTSLYDLEVTASDLDSPVMLYYWDFDNDGSWDLSDQLDRRITHRFESRDPRTVRVGALDQWSRLITETLIEVDGDQPPQITDIRLRYQPRGQTSIEVDALDPEGTTLSYEIWWGDEPIAQGDERPYEPLPRAAGEHSYPFAEAGYGGWVKVTDANGLYSEAPFIATIEDHPTELRELTLNRLNGGEVELRVVGEDLDSPRALLLSVDVYADGDWEVTDQLEPSTSFTFEQAGVYPVKVKLLDPWSGRGAEATFDLTVPAWVREAINEDHVIGEEGGCVVFRVGAVAGVIDSKVDPERCEAPLSPSPEEALWRWQFGDGDSLNGVEVGHRYLEDGVYLVELDKLDPLAPLHSTIQAYISNVAPSFLSEPVTSIVAGELYSYRVRLDDPGQTDELKLSIVSQLTEGMTLTPIEGAPREWQIEWQTPRLSQEDELFVELKVEDGHTDAEGVWRPDGGEARQRWKIRLSETPFDPTPEGSTFAGTGATPQGCDQAQRSPSSSALWALLMLGLLALRQRGRGLTLGALLGYGLYVTSGLALPQRAQAQDLQLFTPSSGDWNYMNAEGAHIIGTGEWAVSSAVSYGRNPLVRLDDQGRILEVVVDYVTSAELSAVIGVFDRLELGLHVPYLFSSGLSQPYEVDDASGPGDIRLTSKLGLYRAREKRGFSAAFNWLNHLPTGDARNPDSRRAFVTEGRLSGEYRAVKWRTALNASYRYRPTNSPLTELMSSNGPTLGVAAGYQLLEKLELLGEYTQRYMTYDRSPFEILFALRARPKEKRPETLSVTLGGGFGLGTDYSSVEMRLFAGLTWRPGDDAPVAVSCQGGGAVMPATTDQDGDGVSDQFDRCPSVAEDRDGFEDSDGCPDTDNDHDGIVDALDQCMNEPEVKNGYQDEDGCPDTKPKTSKDEHEEEGQLLDITERVFFKHNESVLLPKSFPTLKQISDLMARYPQIEELRVEGHTDDTGAKEFNLTLSRDRAAAVRTYLIKSGVKASRLTSMGYGDERPIASNDTAEGRALNRRVNFRITKGPQEIFVVQDNPPDTTQAEPKPAPLKEPAGLKSPDLEDEEPTVEPIEKSAPVKEPSGLKEPDLDSEEPSATPEAVQEPAGLKALDLDSEEPSATPEAVQEPALKALDLDSEEPSATPEAVQEPALKALDLDAEEPTEEPAVQAPKGERKGQGQAVKVSPTKKKKLFSIQVKASSDLKDAESQSALLDKARFKNYVLSQRSKGKMVHRVRLGPYQGRAEAEEALTRYQERFPKSKGAFMLRIGSAEAKSALR